MKKRLRKKLSKRMRRRHFDFMRGVEHGMMLANSMRMFHQEPPLLKALNQLMPPMSKKTASAMQPGNLMQTLRSLRKKPVTDDAA